MYSIIGNASICPVVYEILEELRKNIILSESKRGTWEFPSSHLETDETN